jgi:hypothetical protein
MPLGFHLRQKPTCVGSFVEFSSNPLDGELFEKKDRRAQEKCEQELADEVNSVSGLVGGV